MAENSQIPRRGYILLTELTKPNLEGGLRVDNGPGPDPWPSRWLFIMTASIQSLKKVGYNPLHSFKRNPDVFFLLTF